MKKVYSFLVCIFISISIFAQDYSKLYLIGSATAAGWTNAAALPMTLVQGSDAVFTWTGQLKPGELKFLNAVGTWSNAFTTTATTSVVLGQSYNLLFNAGTDYKFNITATDLYTVTVDMRHLTMTIVKAVITLPTDFWAVGTAVPNGKQKLKYDVGGNATKLKYIGQLTAGGTLKFISTETEGAQTQYLVPVTANTEIMSSTNSKLVSDANAAGWVVSASSSTYKIQLNVLDNTVTTENFQPWSIVYIVGGATGLTWDPVNAIPLAVDPLDPYTFTYNGNLQIGSGMPDANKFKFIGQNTAWGPKNLLAGSADQPIIGATGLLMNNTDNKWIVSADQQGSYTIKVNLLNETIEARFNGPTTATDQANNTKYFTVIPQKGSVVVKLNAAAGHADLFDFSGRKIASGRSSSGILLGNNLPGGIYLIKVNVDGKLLNEKILIK